jgi:hypothetical protein
MRSERLGWKQISQGSPLGHSRTEDCDVSEMGATGESE